MTPKESYKITVHQHYIYHSAQYKSSKELFHKYIK
jgi:hypothetical protein